MKIAVIGAGALGLMFGARLSQDNEVYLLDVNPTMVKAINEKGVTYEDALTGEKSLYHPHAYLNGTLDIRPDVVFVLVKTNYTEDSLKGNRNLIDGKTYFVTLQNGLGNEEKLSKFIDEDHLILGVTRNNSNRLDLTTVKRANHGMTTLGFNEKNQDFAEELAQVMSAASFETALDSDIRRVVWSKLFLNLCSNPICAYYNISIGEAEANPEIWEKGEHIIREAVAVAEKDGVHFDADKTVKSVKQFMHGLYDGHPSMWQDAMHKRKTEIMTMNGAVAALGKKYGIPTPYNDWIVSKIQEMESKF